MLCQIRSYHAFDSNRRYSRQCSTKSWDSEWYCMHCNQYSWFGQGLSSPSPPTMILSRYTHRWPSTTHHGQGKEHA